MLLSDALKSTVEHSFSVSNIHYIILASCAHLQSVRTAPGKDENQTSTCPVTVFALPSHTSNDLHGWLQNEKDRLLASNDDVWQESFLKVTVLLGTAESGQPGSSKPSSRTTVARMIHRCPRSKSVPFWLRPTFKNLSMASELL